VQSTHGPGARPVALVLGAVVSVQVGAALAATLFDDLGPAGTVLLRLGLSALLMGAVVRPALRGRSREHLRVAVLFGLALGAMNLSFYLALDRIPLGIAVTLEFVGPLGVAVAGSRRAVDLVWVALAATGVVLLSGGGGSGLDPVGVLFALLAGAFWAAYIVLSQRTGEVFPGGQGLAIAMVVGTVLVLPAGVLDGGAALLDPGLLGLGAAVALLSSVIPYSFELEALRSLPKRVFSVLLSLEPGAAALAGFVVLGQDLEARQIAAIALVVIASAGAARGARPVREPVAGSPAGV